MARFGLSPTTAPRTLARTKYWNRFRTAYGDRRLQFAAPHPYLDNDGRLQRARCSEEHYFTVPVHPDTGSRIVKTTDTTSLRTFDLDDVMKDSAVWKELEDRVRTVASYIWNAPVQSATIHGVRMDAVLELTNDRWIILEITTSNTLEKLRTDLSKFAAIRPALLSDGIHATCYFVTDSEPTSSIKEAASANRVTALSVDQLERQFIDYEAYRFLRGSKPFGSAVDPFSGEKDTLPYVPVDYLEVHGNRKHSIENITNSLTIGKRTILLGNYGTGKSRCIQETYSRLCNTQRPYRIFPLAIDLRDHWGLRRGPELIRRHFEDLGLSKAADAALKVIDKGAVVLLLDGFDEIASQVWSDDPDKLTQIRQQSLAGVADLVKIAKGGVLIVGREHYFNSSTEMFKCLGLDPGSTVVLGSAEEFSSEQMERYLKGVGSDIRIPSWLPRRPLISKMLASFEKLDLGNLLEDHGEIDFWNKLLNAICIREARIHPSLDPLTIRNVLLELAHLSRTKTNSVGPLSLKEINDTFELVVRRPPRDEASAMLQRLPVLGRVDADTSDRQFVDTYILDGLRATAVAEMPIVGTHTRIMNDKWQHPLGTFGQSVLSQNIATSGNIAGYKEFVKRLSGANNRVLAGDIVTALLAIEDSDYDFGGLVLSDSHLGTISLTDTRVRNLRIRDSFIDELVIEGAAPTSLELERCMIGVLRGLSSNDKLPAWMKEVSVEQFDSLSNVAKIREARLSKEQKIFVTIVHKTFFQPGSGRKEDALLRGLGQSGDKRIARRILSMLLEEGMLKQYPGRQGAVYIPARKHTRRMGQIISQLRYSNDPLWKRLEV